MHPLLSIIANCPFTAPWIFPILPPIPPFFCKLSKAALVSVEEKAWCLVSFELSYVNSCSHICLTVLDGSTRKWNESVTNVLASVELFSDSSLPTEAVFLHSQSPPWDGNSSSFRMKGKQFLSLTESTTKEMFYRVAGIRIRGIEIKVFFCRYTYMYESICISFMGAEIWYSFSPAIQVLALICRWKGSLNVIKMPLNTGLASSAESWAQVMNNLCLIDSVCA